jgi:DNA-binding CsgD family transcriptional regulator
VVLQRLLPGVTAAARRWSLRPHGGPDALDELLAATWTAIRTYPVERRPLHVAARLIREAEYHAFVRPHRRMLVVETVPGDRLDLPVLPVDDTLPSVELAELIAAAHTLTERDRELLALIIAGRSVGEVAATLQVSVRTVTNHREAMISRLRQTARALAAA